MARLDNHPSQPTERDDWPLWQRQMMHQVNKTADNVEKIQEDVTQCRVDIARLQVKSGLTGAIGGCIAAAILWLVNAGK